MVIAIQIALVFVMLGAVIGVRRTNEKKELQFLFGYFIIIAVAALIGCAMYL